MRVLVCGSRNLGPSLPTSFLREVITMFEALRKGDAAQAPDGRRLLEALQRLEADQDFVAIRDRLKALNDLYEGDVVIVEGEAPGADLLARVAGLTLGVDSDPYPADWDRLGNSAGPIRNQQMLDEGKPDLVIAFHTDPRLGRGTADMVRRAKKAGVPVEVHILEEQ